MEAAFLEQQRVTWPLPLGADKAPPASFRLFGVGKNPTVYGDFYLAEDGGAQAESGFRAGGVDLAFDWHHWSEQTDNPEAPVTPENTRAAGWFGLEARPADGLWAVTPPHLDGATGIHWTPTADAQLRALEYRYFSGAILFRRDADGRAWIMGITSCALTNRPAALDQKPLLASAAGSVPGSALLENVMPDQSPADLAKEKAYLAAERIAAMARMLLKKPDETDPSEIVGGLQALAAKAAQHDALVLRVEQITLEKNEVEARSLIAQAKFEKKVAPTEEAHLLSWGKNDPKQLKAYLADKPRAIPGLDVKEPSATGTTTGPALTLEDGRKFEDLKPIERHNLSKNQPETYKLVREDWEKRGKPQAKAS